LASLRERFLSLDSRFAWLSGLADESSVWRRLASLLAHSGDSWLILPVLGLVWWFGRGEWKTLALAMILGVVLTALVVFVIKLSVRRSRPQGEWGKIYRSTDPHSFPSGHAARATMLAAVAAGLGSPWLGLGLLIWALLVGTARVMMGVHYPSDVAAGLLLGALMGLVVRIIY
jgi:undecaprenyl-diphosphatase